MKNLQAIRAFRHLVLLSVYMFVLGLLPIGRLAFTAQAAGTKQSVHTSPVKGRKICLDPGHGGNESGAVGPGGLREKDVNLKEALLLKQMLEQAGASVIMTRSDDSSVSIGRRGEINREAQSDLFVSLHHNANAQADSTMNRIEVFYHYKDEGGPSDDAARLVYRELQSALGYPGKAYMCWAYGVLRDNRYPAILAEPSYLANPEEETRLRDDQYIKKIVEAYFRGIEAFFDGGRPEVIIGDPAKTEHGAMINATIHPLPESAPVDPQRIRVEWGGVPTRSFTYNSETGELVIPLPEEAAKEPQELLVAARNIAGRSSFVERKIIEPVQPAVSTVPSRGQAPLWGGVLAGKKIILDAEGGGDDARAIGANGLRASDANLETVLFLEDYLIRAGAEVHLTRRMDAGLDNVSRVRFGLQRDPDFFLSVGYRMPEPGMGEKAGEGGTRAGARWSGGTEISRDIIAYVRDALSASPASDDVFSTAPLPGEIHNWSSWEVMHAAQKYTAFHVCPLLFDGPDVAERLANTATSRKAALGIAQGLAAWAGASNSNTGVLRGQVVDAQGQPESDALVELDGSLVTQTEQDGMFVFRFLKPGGHNVIVRTAGKPAVQAPVTLEAGKTAPLRVVLSE